ncbi:YqaA family protein [Phytohalomonas tamaricis]|uniref:YqaA family protein n=1 Tax=Phytohalomonas tamaricis TaxID=2081032 RepID=UPI000D0B3E7E|nr:VTT domain-containing protein [Phytohalomonas tamaricis]
MSINQTKAHIIEHLKQLMDSRRAPWLLFIASMLETLILPIPIETILIPWMLARPARLWRLAAIALTGNLLAAAIGYGLGAWAMGHFSDQLIGLFGGQQAYQAFDQRFAEHGFWAIVSIGIVPIPFQIAMLVAGSTGYSFLMFMLAALLARGARYFGLALLVHSFGERAKRLWRGNEHVLGAVAVVMVIAWVGWQVGQ